MKKYLRLKCTKCKREVDNLVDITRYAPDQCTITLGCEGRLQPLEYRSSGGVAIAPEVGVKDWRPRGFAATALQPIEPSLISLKTGALKQLVLAVYSTSEPPDNGAYTLQLAVTADIPKVYRQYVFRKEGAFTTVSGTESGLEKKSLRFDAIGANPDQVEVYVNGVQREQGLDPQNYQIYMSNASSAPPNTILFNTLLDSPGNTQVDVIVSKEATASSLSLTFTRNKPDESRITAGSWENVSYVDKLNTAWKRYYLFTLDLDDASIPLNSIMVPAAVDAFFLLAREPYTQVDRYSNIAASLEGMSSERDYIKFYVEDGKTTARVTDTAISAFFPPLRLGKFLTEKTIKKSTPGVDEQLVIDGKVITGPDA